MKRLFPRYLILLMVLDSCATTHPSFDKKEYKRSKPIATYTGMGSLLKDGYLVLKENGYFGFYEKSWFIITIKQNVYPGHYARKGDTLYLDWLHADPKRIAYYLSGKCLIAPSEKMVWFLDETTNAKLWGLSLASKK